VLIKTILWRGARVLATLGLVACGKRKGAGLCGDAPAITMTVTEALEGNAAGDALGHSTEHIAIVPPEG